jgi:hypothetical protein
MSLLTRFALTIFIIAIDLQFSAVLSFVIQKNHCKSLLIDNLTTVPDFQFGAARN